MVQLAQIRERFEAVGVNVAAMTYDDRAILARFQEDKKLGFPLLQDVDAAHVKAYGVLNTDYEPGHMGYGIPFPGILYIKADGTLGAKFAVLGYRERPPFEDVFAEVYRIISDGD